MGDTPKCMICGEPMPEGEQMFKFHGYSGPCPKPRLPKRYSYDSECERLAEHFLSDLPAAAHLCRDLAQHIQDEVERWLECEIKERGGNPPELHQP